jgi:hypothetical protein
MNAPANRFFTHKGQSRAKATKARQKSRWMVSCHCLSGTTVQEEDIKMFQFRFWFFLIVLVFGCSALGNGCSKAVRPPDQAASAPQIRPPDQTVAAPQKIRVILPLGYVATSTRDLASPDWVKESVKRTTGIGTWMDGETLGGLMGATQIGAAAACAYVAYLPVAAAVGTIAGKAAGKKWGPCLQELAREITAVDPAAALQRRLEEELHRFRDAETVALSPEGDPFLTAAQRGMKGLLVAEIQRIQIKQCEGRGGAFCLQVSLRAQLWTVPEKTSYLDKVLVYTSSLPRQLPPSEVWVLGTSPCRTMEDYCGASGKQRFREELTDAIDNLVKRLSLEMAL